MYKFLFVTITILVVWFALSHHTPKSCDNLPRINREIEKSLIKLKANKVNGEFVPGPEVRKYNQLRTDKLYLETRCTYISKGDYYEEIQVTEK